MSDRTKLILAVTLGSVGLALGILGTIVAFNAKNEATSNQELTAVVDQRFADAQKRQDELEASQVSEAERLVNSLSTSESGLIKKINTNASGVSRLTRKFRNIRRQIRGLEAVDNRLSQDLADVQRQVERNLNETEDQINRLNQRVNRLQAGGFTP